MKAYHPNGSLIVGTLETVQACSATVSDGFSRDETGKVCYEHEGGTEIFWDGMETVERDGAIVFLAADGEDCTEYGVVLSGADGKQWTVLVLRPDCMWEGSARDWTYQAHVIALDVAGAGVAGCEQAANSDGYDVFDDYAVLAVYAGHLSDVADTS